MPRILSMLVPNSCFLSFPRRRESSFLIDLIKLKDWIPACAGMTGSVLFLFCLLSLPALAVEDVVVFSDESLRARYNELIHELRCPKCQNQNLADSNAPIADDLREQVHQLLEQGKSNDEIKNYLRQRYSDFVLYRPAVNWKTWLLWAMPVCILLAGFFVLLRIFLRQKKPLDQSEQSIDQQRLAELLDGEDNHK